MVQSSLIRMKRKKRSCLKVVLDEKGMTNIYNWLTS